jgi:ribonuclease HII
MSMRPRRPRGATIRSGPDFEAELRLLRKGVRLIAGIDEAGRGPWAGPVVAAAVILDGEAIPAGLDDSKLLNAAAREQAFALIMARAQVGIGIGEVARVDRDNILQATMWAMAEAVRQLPVAPEAALVDGNRLPDLACPAEALVGGDGRSLSIAAASIIAKVTRDRLMTDLAASHPGYGWETNKGYGTAAHRRAMEELGLTPHHRRSFQPVRALATGLEPRVA